eukprot:g27230.t1
MAEDPESVALLAEEAEQRPRPGCNRLVTLLPVVALLSLAFFFTPHTKSLRGNEAGAVQLSLLLFEPVDGGIERACRGADQNDNNPSHFVVTSASDLASCQLLCLEYGGCQGVEFHSGNGRCELWIRPDGIQASRSFSPAECYRRVGILEPVDGGAQSFEDCQRECLIAAECRGIEFSAGRCEIWTRPEGIQASISLSGFQCYRATSTANTETTTATRCEIWTRLDGIQASREVAGYQCLEAVMFAPVDGGQNRACRGNAPGDNLPEYYQIATAFSMEDCQQQCEANSTTCTGVEFSGNRCEIWNRAIWTSIALDGFQCFRYVSRVQMTFLTEVLASTWDITGGVDVECRASSLQRCQDRCLALTICKGIEYRRGHCELWTRPGGIQATKPLADSVCLQRPGSSPPGAVQTKYDRTLITPFLQMMGPTLDLASKFQPEFVQVITWNDYSEGTMIEPSWVRPRNLCLSACAQNVQNCLTTAACDSGFDPLDCSKPYGNFSGPVDPQCNSNAIASADDDLRLLAEHIRAEAEGTLQLDYGALSTFTGLVTETEGWYYRS